MKILFDTHSVDLKLTGIGRYWKNLINRLEFNKDIGICLYGNSHVKNDLKHSAYSPFMDNGVYRVLFGFNKSIQLFKPSLIHVSNFPPFTKTVPIVTTIHDLCFRTNTETFMLKSRLIFNLFFQKSLHQSDAIICVSNSVKDNLLKYYSIDPNKIFTIYHGIDEMFKYDPNKQRVRQILKNKYSINNKYFLVVGDIIKRKNPFPVIKAFKNLLEKKSDVQLIFAGQNKMGNFIELKYKDMISSNHLKILNHVGDSDLNLLYNGANTLIFNSFCEGFGLPIIEAMNCKTPVICNDIKIFREVANNAAIFTKNEREIYLAMEKIISNQEFRKKYCELGYKRSRFYSWDKTAKQTLEVYKWVLESKKSSITK